MTIESAIQESIQYLSSDAAATSIRNNPYWPKWNSPWWNMSVLFEMGLADKIPKRAASLMLSEIKHTHLPYFFREEAPANKTEEQDCPCPCSLGNIYQILSAVGLDVDGELPWARVWFLKYQMPDGGLSCDEDAYKADPNASSMVGTISPLEAILKTRATLSPDEELFLDRGAQCLIKRQLRLGSSSTHNAEERLDEADWLKPCFPRFYFYDVLRGLSFILLWSEKRRKPIPRQSIEKVVTHLKREFPTDQIQIQRRSFDGVTDRKKQPASYFSLQEQVSIIGQVSAHLTHQWQQSLSLIEKLTNEGLIR